MKNEEIIHYQPDETIRLDVRMEDETVWLTQAQLVELFQKNVSTISRHISNIFQEGELEKESNLRFLQIASSDKPVMLYSLDVIISVGYRVKSQRGVRFRQWANRIIKEHLLGGYSNRLLENKIEKLEAYIEEIISDQNEINEDTRTQLELINQTIAELQVKEHAKTARKPIGFTAYKKE